MKYLLDTHVILWALVNDKRITKDLKDKLLDNNNQVFYSIVSPWEVELKHQKIKSFSLTGKQLCFLCDQNHILNLPIRNNHIVRLSDFAKMSEAANHHDPFDKMLLAQALEENMILVTHDDKFKAYDSSNIMII